MPCHVHKHTHTHTHTHTEREREREIEREREREMAYQLKALAALPEVPSSIPSNHMVTHKHL
jgi:hypothetical protein